MSAQSATSLNYTKVAAVFTERGFLWQFANAENVLANSNDISFEDEWNQFATLVANITHDDKTIKPSPQAASDVWEKYFKNIVLNSGKTHDSFRDSLFDALRNSLEGFVFPQEGHDSNLIVLQSSHTNVGFGKEVHRKKLGFKKDYGLAKNKKFDHGCFVLGSMKQNASENQPKNKYYDMTAIVELKKESESCQGFAVDETGEIKIPNFESVHGPIGQAMIYSLDVWHSLARHGVSATSVPVVVLAGKSEEAGSSMLCCVEAQIHIPEYCGNPLSFSVERIVSFDGTSGMFRRNEMNVVDSAMALRIARDKKTLALYIKTMQIGLERAVLVSAHCNMPHPLSPVSLCF
jgi:hypothetical protein